MITWEEKCHHSEHPPFLFPSLAFIDERTMMWSGISVCLLGIVCPNRVPSQILVHVQSTLVGEGEKQEKP